MSNIYCRDVIEALQTSDKNVIMAYRSRLTEDQINLIGEVAIEEEKTVIFATVQAVLFNNNDNILVIK